MRSPIQSAAPATAAPVVKPEPGNASGGGILQKLKDRRIQFSQSQQASSQPSDYNK